MGGSSPRQGSRRRRARSRAGSTFSRQLRLGEVRRCPAQDLVLLLEQADPLLQLAVLGRFGSGGPGHFAVLDVGLAHPLRQGHFMDAEVLGDLRERHTLFAGASHAYDVVTELLG